MELVPATGMVWRIYPAGGQALRPDGPIIVEAVPRPEAQRQPEVPNVPETYRAVAPPLLIIAGGVTLILIVVIVVKALRPW